MSWLAIPGRVRPSIVRASYPVLLVGQGADEGRVCYSNDAANECVIPANDLMRWMNGIKVGDVTLYPVPGRRVYDSYGRAEFCWASGDAKLWYDGGKWIYSADPTLVMGNTPAEAYDSETGEWTGNAWYSASSIPTRPSATVSFTARGRLHGEADVTLEYYWPRWKKDGSVYTLPPIFDAFLGKYEAVDGADDSVTPFVGLPYWEGGWYHFTRSYDKVEGHWEYLGNGYTIKYMPGIGRWVMGTVGSAYGWWESSDEPEVGGSTTFEAKWPEGDPGGVSEWIEDITVSNDGDDMFEWGSQKEKALLTQIARWM